MIAEFFRGLRSYGNAHRVIIRHRLWRFLVIPGILSIAVVIAIIWFGGVYFDNWANTLVQYALPESLRGDATRAIAMVLLWILLVLLAFMTYKHITLAFLAPILGHLSEKTEVLLGHQSAEGFSIARLLQDFGRWQRIYAATGNSGDRLVSGAGIWHGCCHHFRIGKS